MFEVPEAEIASLSDLVVDEITIALKVDAPLVVDVNSGDPDSTNGGARVKSPANSNGMIT